MADSSLDDAIPRRRLVAAALCLNEAHEVLLVKPTYRESWLLPGGMVEAEESPHAGCVREVYEELGLMLPCSRLLCVDYRVRQGAKAEAVHFLFAGGILSAAQIGTIRLPPEELMAFQFVPLAEAVGRLPAKGARLLTHALVAWETEAPCYLEGGEPLQENVHTLMDKREATYRAIIGRALTTAIHNDLQPPVVDEFDYGAIGIDPGLLTLKYMFADEAALDEAERSGVCDTIKQRVFQALECEGYPKNALAGVHVGFASQEEVRAAGGPWNYFR